MEDANSDRMSIATIIGNSGKPWMHLVNELYIKNKTDDMNICFNQ